MSNEHRGVVHVYPDKKLVRNMAMVHGHAAATVTNLGVLIMAEGGSWQRRNQISTQYEILPGLINMIPSGQLIYICSA